MDEQEIAEQAQDTVESLKNSPKQWTRKAQGAVRDASAAADLYLHEYAWTIMALVTVSAGLLGLLIGRSSRRRRGL
jgi:ElaB/YqjD/DUF883 family membrane-anchored ribosome-binding protein